MAGGDHHPGRPAGDGRSYRGDRAAAEHGGREDVADCAEAGGAVGEVDRCAVGGGGYRIRIARGDEGVDVHGDDGCPLSGATVKVNVMHREDLQCTRETHRDTGDSVRR